MIKSYQFWPQLSYPYFESSLDQVTYNESITLITTNLLSKLQLVVLKQNWRPQLLKMKSAFTKECLPYPWHSYSTNWKRQNTDLGRIVFHLVHCHNPLLHYTHIFFLHTGQRSIQNLPLQDSLNNESHTAVLGNWNHTPVHKNCINRVIMTQQKIH